VNPGQELRGGTRDLLIGHDLSPCS
jgi:hypothetical protein